MVSRPVEGLRRARAPRGAGVRLRAEILDAATGLLLETGHARSVSIRSVAERVGVTPPSIYLHFADKEALMDAVCARYFENLDSEMRRALVEHTSPVGVLRAQGLAYVRFATQNPELYRIATMGQWRSGSSVDATLDSSAFTYMRATVRRLMDDGIYQRDDPTKVALRLWSAAHGVAAMVIAKPHLPFGEVEMFADSVLCSVFCGQVVMGYCDADATPQMLAEWVTTHRRWKDPQK
ncbi:TetR family transcriptional regulator [Mycobacterium saskatchewanense]|nr:TetR family transcriptional regulator [Mycobacterium saskatchewanense]